MRFGIIFVLFLMLAQGALAVADSCAPSLSQNGRTVPGCGISACGEPGSTLDSTCQCGTTPVLTCTQAPLCEQTTCNTNAVVNESVLARVASDGSLVIYTPFGIAGSQRTVPVSADSLSAWTISVATLVTKHSFDIDTFTRTTYALTRTDDAIHADQTASTSGSLTDIDPSLDGYITEAVAPFDITPAGYPPGHYVTLDLRSVHPPFDRVLLVINEDGSVVARTNYQLPLSIDTTLFAAFSPDTLFPGTPATTRELALAQRAAGIDSLAGNPAFSASGQDITITYSTLAGPVTATVTLPTPQDTVQIITPVDGGAGSLASVQSITRSTQTADSLGIPGAIALPDTFTNCTGENITSGISDGSRIILIPSRLSDPESCYVNIDQLSNTSGASNPVVLLVERGDSKLVIPTGISMPFNPVAAPLAAPITISATYPVVSRTCGACTDPCVARGGTYTTLATAGTSCDARGLRAIPGETLAGSYACCAHVPDVDHCGTDGQPLCAYGCEPGLSACAGDNDPVCKTNCGDPNATSTVQGDTLVVRGKSIKLLDPENITLPETPPSIDWSVDDAKTTLSVWASTQFAAPSVIILELAPAENEVWLPLTATLSNGTDGIGTEEIDAPLTDLDEGSYRARIRINDQDENRTVELRYADGTQFLLDITHGVTSPLTGDVVSSDEKAIAQLLMIYRAYLAHPSKDSEETFARAVKAATGANGDTRTLVAIGKNSIERVVRTSIASIYRHALVMSTSGQYAIYSDDTRPSPSLVAQAWHAMHGETNRTQLELEAWRQRKIVAPQTEKWIKSYEAGTATDGPFVNTSDYGTALLSADTYLAQQIAIQCPQFPACNAKFQDCPDHWIPNRAACKELLNTRNEYLSDAQTLDGAALQTLVGQHKKELADEISYYATDDLQAKLGGLVTNAVVFVVTAPVMEVQLARVIAWAPKVKTVAAVVGAAATLPQLYSLAKACHDRFTQPQSAVDASFISDCSNQALSLVLFAVPTPSTVSAAVPALEASLNREVAVLHPTSSATVSARMAHAEVSGEAQVAAVTSAAEEPLPVPTDYKTASATRDSYLRPQVTDQQNVKTWDEMRTYVVYADRKYSTYTYSRYGFEYGDGTPCPVSKILETIDRCAVGNCRIGDFPPVLQVKARQLAAGQVQKGFPMLVTSPRQIRRARISQIFRRGPSFIVASNEAIPAASLTGGNVLFKFKFYYGGGKENLLFSAKSPWTNLALRRIRSKIKPGSNAMTVLTVVFDDLARNVHFSNKQGVAQTYVKDAAYDLDSCFIAGGVCRHQGALTSSIAAEMFYRLEDPRHFSDTYFVDGYLHAWSVVNIDGRLYIADVAQGYLGPMKFEYGDAIPRGGQRYFDADGYAYYSGGLIENGIKYNANFRYYDNYMKPGSKRRAPEEP